MEKGVRETDRQTSFDKQKEIKRERKCGGKGGVEIMISNIEFLFYPVSRSHSF